MTTKKEEQKPINETPKAKFRETLTLAGVRKRRDDKTKQK